MESKVRRADKAEELHICMIARVMGLSLVYQTSRIGGRFLCSNLSGAGLRLHDEVADIIFSHATALRGIWVALYERGSAMDAHTSFTTEPAFRRFCRCCCSFSPRTDLMVISLLRVCRRGDSLGKLSRAMYANIREHRRFPSFLTRQEGTMQFAGKARSGSERYGMTLLSAGCPVANQHRVVKVHFTCDDDTGRILTLT